MLVLLSPAKSLDFSSRLTTRKASQPRLLDDASALIDVLRTLSPSELAGLMDISPELADLNVQRYAEFSAPFTAANARPAVLAFNGDVYQGLNASGRFDERDFTEAQKTVRILSGLYGVLRPLDLIQPYRLEMGARLRTGRGRSLYDWWGERITDLVAADLTASPGPSVVVNLASQEYASSVHFDRLPGRVISPRFEDPDSQGRLRVVSFSAKRARGMMAGWIVAHRVRSVRALQGFDEGGYQHSPQRSTPQTPVYTRSSG